MYKKVCPINDRRETLLCNTVFSLRERLPAHLHGIEQAWTDLML